LGATGQSSESVSEGRTEALPDDALVVRGGQNLPESFVKGSGVTVGPDQLLEHVSVNSGPGLSVEDLTAAIAATGYLGIPNRQVGVTTVGATRKCGGEVVPSPTRTNPNHATLSGVTPDQASQLFRPTLANPSRRKKT
jgi:hypothetical protein